jgi:hypothetical protein
VTKTSNNIASVNSKIDSLERDLAILAANLQQNIQKNDKALNIVAEAKI